MPIELSVVSVAGAAVRLEAARGADAKTGGDQEPSGAALVARDGPTETSASAEGEPVGVSAREVQALQEDVARIAGLYREAGRALRAADPANWAAGLTMPQIRVLFFLGRTGPASVGEVASGLGVSQPSATETLDRLVRAGLVERTPDPSDRRVVRNALTPAGQEMIDRPWETRRAVLASALRDASPEDRAAIERGLELLCRALGRAGGSG